MSDVPTQPSRFVRLARWCNRHRGRTIGAWLLALIVMQLAAGAAGTRTASSVRLPGTESQRAYDLLAAHAPGATGDSDQIVYRASAGTLRDARARITGSLRRVAAAPGVAAVRDPFEAGGRLTAGERIGIATVTYEKSADATDIAALERVQRASLAARAPGLQVEHGGPGAARVRSESGGDPTQAVAVVAAAVVLLVTFG